MEKVFSKKQKILIVLVIVVIELVASFFLIYQYYLKTKPVVADLSKQTQKATNSNFSYFYELKADTTETDHPDWLTNPAIYHYNKDGLNDRFDYKIEKQTNTFRIITLGDSYTFGHFISTDENWTEVLEKYLNENSNEFNNYKFEVINLGVAGYDIPYIVERYRLKGQKYQPDLVVWLESGSGFFRNIELFKPEIEKCEQLNPIKENQAKAYRNCWIEAEIKIKNYYGKEQLANLINESFSKFFNLVNAENVLFFGFKYSTPQPDWEQALTNRLKQYPQINFIQEIPDITQTGVLADGHPNASGHETIAKTILTFIRPIIQEKTR